ncbi:MAG TPA: M23 family metallopeptidase [Acidobacteriota bacterium]|nr:M23 family metallopeptidase [Acidobacteriota bacterium]
MILPLNPMPAIPIYDSMQEHPHPGSFRFPRHFDVHCGIDLYAPMGAPVHAMEAGRVIQVDWFTGPSVDTPWWRDTRAVYVEGESGVIIYGEVQEDVKEGDEVAAGQVIAYVMPVLNHWKGRPMSMLHLELYDKRWTETLGESEIGESEPDYLKDPTNLFLGLELEFVAIDPYAKEAADWAKNHQVICDIQKC